MKYLLLLPLLLSLLSYAQLSPEPIPSVKKLPVNYPSTWLFAHDANFYSLMTGRVIIVDVAADTQEYKGAISAAQFGTFVSSSQQNELYVGESFYSRGTTGDRTDVVSIYEKETLNKIDEIILPNNNRAQIVTNKYAFRLINDDRFLLVFGFTPASSVIVVDTQKRKVINEIGIPGCSMIYPTAKLGFSSLCADGSLLSVTLDETGHLLSKKNVPPFFDVDKDPLFDKPVYANNKAYFASYTGMIYPINMTGDIPSPEAPWDLLSEAERSVNWRPGGWQIMTTNGNKEIMIIMHKNGYNGSHKLGGEEIWVYNLESRQRTRKISLKNNAFSIEIVGDKSLLLAVTNTDMGMDIYNIEGVHQRFISLGDTVMPFILHSQR